MHILITNDDGIYSPGIKALAKAASKFGDVQVVAPGFERSAAGQSISTSTPIRYKEASIPFDVPAFECNGTPADCVALGTHLRQTDVVLSGVNMGPNLGNAMWHSGTLAAAKQAVLFGIKGIALSTPTLGVKPDFVKLAPDIEQVLDMLLKTTEVSLYNVNFPMGAKGIQWTRQSVRLYDGKIVPSMDPMGRKNYWFTVVPLEPAEEGTDRWAVENGYISITPLRLDLTDQKKLEEMTRQKL